MKFASTIGLGGWAYARPLILLLSLAALVVPAASPSNYGFSESGNPIMCNQAHNGITVNVSSGTYRCGFHYDPPYHTGYYEPGWGWIGLCPSFSPYMGYCWAWRQ